MKVRSLVATSAFAGMLLAPLGAVTAGATAVPAASGVIDVTISGSTPQFSPDNVKVVGSTACDPGQMQITNKTKKTLTLVEGGNNFQLAPHNSVSSCFTPGAGGVTYKVKYTIQGYSSVLKVKIVPS